MVFYWFKKVNHAQQIDTNNGQAHNYTIEKEKIKILVGESGEPGLVDRVLALHAGSRGFDSYRGTCPNDFSDPIDQNIRTQ